MKKYRFWIVCIVLLVVGGIVLDSVASVTHASLTVYGSNVRFDSPGNGLLEASWSEPLTMYVVDIPLTSYARFDNP